MDFLSSPVLKTPHTSSAGGSDSIPGWENEIPYAIWQDQKKKKLTKGDEGGAELGRQTGVCPNEKE